MDRIDQYLEDVLGPVILGLAHRGSPAKRAAPKPVSKDRKPAASTVAELKNALGGSEGLVKFAAGLKVAGIGGK